MTTAPVTCVLVDDHPVVRDGLRHMLERDPGLRVVGEASSGPEGIAVVRDTDPDVVLMDLRMPGGGGAEAIRALQRDPATRARVLVLTTYDTDRDIRVAMEAGAHGYLLKDTPQADLVRAVHDVAAGRPVLAPVALSVLAKGGTVGPELTARETEVLRLVAQGHPNRAVASRLGVGEATVKTHLLHVYDKLQVGDRAAAVRVAYERGLLG